MAVIITASKQPRAGWTVGAGELREQDQDHVLDESVTTRFDEKDWKWA